MTAFVCSTSTIFPVLRYEDAPAAIEWLGLAFGFEKQAAFQGQDGTIVHAELRLGPGVIGLSSATPPVESNPWTSVRQGVYVTVEDPGVLAEPWRLRKRTLTFSTAELPPAVACNEQDLSQVVDGAILVNVGHSDREIDVDWLDRHPATPIRRHLDRYELGDGRRVHLLNRGSLVNLAAGLGINAPQLFDPFTAIMLLGLDAILSGQTADLPNGVQRYPQPLEARVARALAGGSA